MPEQKPMPYSVNQQKLRLVDEDTRFVPPPELVRAVASLS